MREKLIELLMKTFPNVSGDRGYYACCADELIANGVTITAVPIGSTVYVFRNHIERTNRKGETKVNEYQIVTNNSLSSAIKRNTVVIKEKKACKQDILLLGRLVFKTREEAEAAIKARESV